MKEYSAIQKTSDQINSANINYSNSAKKPVNWKNEVDQLLNKNDGFINICHEAIDKHLSSNSHKVALKFIKKDWPKNNNAITEYTYKELAELSCRFANALKSLGVKKGNTVFSLSPRIPELYFSFFGTMRLGAVFSPLFSAFGPEPIQARILKGHGIVLFSLASYYKKKIEPIRYQLPNLKYLILLDDDGSLKNIPGAIDFKQMINAASPVLILEKTNPEDPALLHFTSGTTGKPKGAIHVHSAVVFHKISAQMALDLKSDDLFWCTADPGWVTGTSYGIIAPLVNGATMLIDETDFLAVRWYQILQDFKVSVWYTAPTAMRMLMKAGEDLPQKFNFKNVRLAASVGEALNPEVILWVKKNLGIILHDNWWQTETGGIIISNYLSMKIKPGSMGKPMPGIEVRLAQQNNENELQFIDKTEVDGEIAVRKGWPAQFRGYLDDEERYKKCFNGDWYLSGDLAHQDDEGYFWFVGRKDDVIKSSGHLIGPFEVESALMEHSAVLESAVIGKPDPLAGELVKAFIVLKAGQERSDDLLSDIMAFSRKRLGIAVAPREFSFIDNLPKTRSGKIMRRLLKARELGLPEGDTSTLEIS